MIILISRVEKAVALTIKGTVHPERHILVSKIKIGIFESHDTCLFRKEVLRNILEDQM